MAVELDEFYPYDSTVGAGTVTGEAQWRQFMTNSMSGGDGVLRGLLDEFETYADSTGMQVKVKPGECWLQGAWGLHATEKTLPIAASDPTNPRIDRIIVRNDFVENRMELDVLQGTPAASPVALAPTRNTSMYECPIATVRVDAGVVTISSDKITFENERELQNPTATHHRYSGSAATSQLITTGGGPKKVVFPDTYYGDYNVRKAANGSDFTFGRSGLWTVTATCSWRNEGAALGGVRFVTMTKTDDLLWKYATDSVPGQLRTGGVPVVNHVSRVRRFDAGETLCVQAFQNSGSDKWIDITTDRPVLISFQWMGY